MLSACRNFKTIMDKLPMVPAVWGDKGNLTDYDNVGNWVGNGITAINSLTSKQVMTKCKLTFLMPIPGGTGYRGLK